MIPLAAQSVGEQLLQLAAQGLGVAVGVSFCFSLALVGTIRATDARRAGKTGAVLPWTLLALAAYVGFGLLLVLGVLVVVDK